MKYLLSILLASVIVGTVQIGSLIRSNYKIEQTYLQEWHLADKSSTLQAKQEHIDKFVRSLEDGYKAGDFASHDAIFLKTANNEFTANLNALKSLQDRLKAVEKMNPNSFEYNTAIQQITAQEQGDAGEMINVFVECYLLRNYVICWGWIGTTIMLVWLCVGVLCAVVALVLFLE